MKRTLCAVLSALFLSVSAIPCAATDSATPLLPAERSYTAFADIPAGTWYADAVKLCYEAGVLNGTSETTFSPQETLTSAQLEVLMARVKWRLEGNSGDLPAAPAGSGAVSITLSDGSTYDAASFFQVAPTGLGGSELPRGDYIVTLVGEALPEKIPTTLTLTVDATFSVQANLARLLSPELRVTA